MSDYPYLLAKLRQYFPKLIVQSYEPDNANSNLSNAHLEVYKFSLHDGLGNTLTPYRLRGKAQLSLFMSGMLSVLTQNDFPLSQSIKKGVKGMETAEANISKVTSNLSRVNLEVSFANWQKVSSVFLLPVLARKEN